jgi:hypothetical protein
VKTKPPNTQLLLPQPIRRRGAPRLFKYSEGYSTNDLFCWGFYGDLAIFLLLLYTTILVLVSTEGLFQIVSDRSDFQFSPSRSRVFQRLGLSIRPFGSFYSTKILCPIPRTTAPGMGCAQNNGLYKVLKGPPFSPSRNGGEATNRRTLLHIRV